MEHECSVLCPQEPTTGPCPEPDQSSPRPSIRFLSSILILSSNLRLYLPSSLFPVCFPTNVLYAFIFSPMRAACPTPFIFLDLLTLLIFVEKYKSGSLSIYSTPSFLLCPVVMSLLGSNNSILIQITRPRYTVLLPSSCVLSLCPS